MKRLFQMSPQRSKNQGSSQESGGTCVFERNQPRDAACRYRTDPLTAAFAGLHFCAHRAGWRNRSGRTTGRTFVGRSGLVSGDIYERGSAASVYEREGINPNQDKPHFERGGVRAQAAGQVLIRHAGWAHVHVHSAHMKKSIGKRARFLSIQSQ